MTDSPAADLMGAVGTAASIGVGMVTAGMVIKQVKSLNRSTKPRRSGKKCKRE